ncbi:uncharacterized protein LOC131943266 [Physella acuta]|uniref:uncharacterized protein LOC131943266 n=1 Tax=Physella acuta TaxID=109671 RepID=UPI0027DD2B81|nr:uncharacterized protein LOC131943266 [Physella acuta]
MGNKASGGANGVPKGIQPSANRHIFVSYCHKDKMLVNKIYRGLTDDGFDVWIDQENMGGNLLEGMAKAVEDSWVVLICMSEHYQSSPNCKIEAEYTVMQHKEYIMLKMQENFSPQGWLGATQGAKKFYDFSKSGNYDSMLKELLKELQAVRFRVLLDLKQVPIVQDKKLPTTSTTQPSLPTTTSVTRERTNPEIPTPSITEPQPRESTPPGT